MAIVAKDRSLEETPTWAVALVCAVFIILSILVEHGIHSLGKWFQKKQKKAMLEALEKIKAELMLLGFISFLLTVGTTYVTKICIPVKAGDTMLPCEEGLDKNDHDARRRKLLSFSEYGHDHNDVSWHRMLAGGDNYTEYCTGKMRKLKGWESDTSSLEYEFTNDPSRFRFTHQTTFVKRHTGFSRKPGLRWVVAFFRQFFGSISKVDYTTMRHGFINAHFAPNSKFDFHKYLQRSMEDDFKVVVGISIPLWIYALILLLLNVYSWHILTWVTFIPLTILLLVGTKLELVIMEMAQQIEDRTTVVKGAPVVEPSNHYFWFNKPHWVLILIHFTTFQNAFQMAYFLWAWYEFGLYSCHRETVAIVVFKVVLGLIIQFICSYITFPLYVLVTQMGSHMKKAIFEEQTANALRKWRKAAKERKKLRTKEGDVSIAYSGIMSGDTTPSTSTSTSPLHLLHKYKSTQAFSPTAPRYHNQSMPDSPVSCSTDLEFSENDYGRKNTTRPPMGLKRVQEDHKIDFSFDKP